MAIPQLQCPLWGVLPTLAFSIAALMRGDLLVKRWFAGSKVALAALAIFTLVPMPGAAQTSATTTYTPPRTPNGQPDLQGIWQVLNTAAWDIQDHAARLGVPAGKGVVEGNEIPYQPSALAKKKENFEQRATLDPETKCYLPGVPRITYMPYPFQIIQQADKVAIVYEYVRAVRYIFMNGNPHPPGHIDWYMGDSRGRWEGNTLVVDVIDFNDETWFDRAGNFHSDELHVVERFTPNGPDHIAYEVTIEDPKVFTRPWKMQMPIYRRKEANAQLLEYECYAFEWEKYYPYPGLW
jgi:hypothetical protein